MANIRYTRDHEYIAIDGEAGTVGITDHAQKALGDIVYVELPAVGAIVARAEQAAVVESVKAASDVFAPVSGEVIAINSALEKQPGAVNEDPLGNGWFYRLQLSNPSELEGLMDEAAYAAYLETLD